MKQQVVVILALLAFSSLSANDIVFYTFANPLNRPAGGHDKAEGLARYLNLAMFEGLNPRINILSRIIQDFSEDDAVLDQIVSIEEILHQARCRALNNLKECFREPAHQENILNFSSIFLSIFLNMLEEGNKAYSTNVMGRVARRVLQFKAAQDMATAAKLQTMITHDESFKNEANTFLAEVRAMIQNHRKVRPRAQ